MGLFIVHGMQSELHSTFNLRCDCVPFPCPWRIVSVLELQTE